MCRIACACTMCMSTQGQHANMKKQTRHAHANAYARRHHEGMSEQLLDHLVKVIGDAPSLGRLGLSLHDMDLVKAMIAGDVPLGYEGHT